MSLTYRKSLLHSATQSLCLRNISHQPEPGRIQMVSRFVPAKSALVMKAIRLPQGCGPVCDVEARSSMSFMPTTIKE
jgi:hypothetical protein